METVHERLEYTKKDIPRFEIEMLLAHAISPRHDRVFVLAHPEQKLTKKTLERFDILLNRRKKSEPMSYLLGKKEFYGRNFLVNHHTLIPRPETELLVEKALYLLSSPALSKESPEKEALKKTISTIIIDIGTGSGNIIITLAKELEEKYSLEKKFSFVATDISQNALCVARRNAKQHGANIIHFFHSNLLKKIPRRIFRNANDVIITANLPYLSEKQYAHVSPDVHNYEPKTALVSGKNGLNHYQRLFKEIEEFLQHNRTKKNPTHITLLLEIDNSQKKSLEKLTKKVLPKTKIHFSKDIAGKWRVVEISM